MLVTNLLPALHAHEHFTSLEGSKDLAPLEFSESIAKPVVDCDLCDFHFSSINEPVLYSYSLHLPEINSVQNISVADTVHLFSQIRFSLRAPPQAIA